MYLEVLILLAAGCAFLGRYAWHLLDAIMSSFDARHRAQCDEIRKSWGFPTRPHVRDTLSRPGQGMSEWRLECDEGRQRWFHDPGHKQSFIERYNLGLEDASPVEPRESLKDALDAGADFLDRLQDNDGHFPNDYSGPLFLVPGAVFSVYIVSEGELAKVWGASTVSQLQRYLVNTQNTDGGWGMHTEGHSTMFGTALNYVALRLLGEPENSEFSAKAQQWLKLNGGVCSIPSWGKAWLCTLGLYDWAGCTPVPPEMWLLPDWLPFSMGRVWCHSRIVTLPFGYLYGKRYRCNETPLLEAIRKELYGDSFSTVDWKSQQDNVFKDDVYTPLSLPFRGVRLLLRLYEKVAIPALRAHSVALSYDHMRYDDESTNYICLGPVNKCLNMVCTFVEEGANSPRLKQHIDRLADYMWLGREGLRMAGYNGSQLWDTSFAVQAVCAGGPSLMENHRTMLRGAHQYVDVAQVREDPPQMEKYYRSRTKGCWNFSTRAQSWQVSDCTAEGLRVVLLLRGTGIPDPFPERRIFDAVDEILALRNDVYGEGWASYEEIRGPAWMELLNCAEVYKDIMREYTYTECTSSCVQTLCRFREQFPDYRAPDVTQAIDAGVRVIKAHQRPDGSWYGSWGVCFTYGAFFAVEGLVAAGEPRSSFYMRRCCEFLLTKQRHDGGWGEDFNGCVTGEWVENPDGSQLVNTAWAMMALLGAGGLRHEAALQAGAAFIQSRQLANGDWPQERISGVFNGNCAIHYASYKNNMCVWALAMLHRALSLAQE